MARRRGVDEEASDPTSTGDDRWTLAVKISGGGTRRVFRRRYLGPFQCVVTAVFAGVLSIGPTQPLASADPALCRVVAAVILLVGAVLGFRLWRRRILIEDDRVLVRNLVTSWSASAGQLASFTPPPMSGRIHRHSGVAVRFTDGRVRYATAFANTPIDGDIAGVIECRELNLWLAEKAGSGPQTALRARPARRAVRLWRRTWPVAALLITLIAFAFGLPAVFDPSALT